MKRLSILLVATLVIATQSFAFTRGKCGPNISYIINDTGDKVIITGSGPMYDYESKTSPFYDNRQIKEVEISDGITTLGEYIFDHCTQLSSIKLPKTLTIIGKFAFYYTNIKKIELPDSLEQIGDNAFELSNITEISIPEKVTTINDYAFSSCFDLKTINLPDNLISIGVLAFSYCKDLKTINIPNSVTSIGVQAFFCSGLEKITLPKSLKLIDINLFWDCSNLEEVTIPENVENIYGGAFYNCTKLKAIYIKSPMPPYVTPSCFDDIDMRNCTLYVLEKPAAALQRYMYTEPWSNFYNIDTFNADAPTKNKYDVNEDGAVNAADVVGIYNYISSGH